MPVYAWYDNTNDIQTIYLYSDADTVYMNENSSYIFSKFPTLTDVQMNRFDTSKVIDMSYMFYYSQYITDLDLSNFVTSGVQNM
jgi:surface protein